MKVRKSKVIKGKLEKKSEIWSLVIYSVGNLQLSQILVTHEAVAQQSFIET